MTKYLDIDELALLLGRSANTIKRNIANDPCLVPPKMHIPNSLMLRWRAHEVESWMHEVGWEAITREPLHR